ncbi:hypothetical protein B0H13DRAFT_2385043 [Mycena leptocephala]|nr:hypothetical protein B0H13DRAFT_2385043 [Mycena leptocephala]
MNGVDNRTQDSHKDGWARANTTNSRANTGTHNFHNYFARSHPHRRHPASTVPQNPPLLFFQITTTFSLRLTLTIPTTYNLTRCHLHPGERCPRRSSEFCRTSLAASLPRTPLSHTPLLPRAQHHFHFVVFTPSRIVRDVRARPPHSTSRRAPLFGVPHARSHAPRLTSPFLSFHAPSALQTNGGANSMMGSAKEMVGGAVGSDSMERDGKEQHAKVMGNTTKEASGELCFSDLASYTSRSSPFLLPPLVFIRVSLAFHPHLVAPR